MTREEMLQAAIERNTDPIFMKSKGQISEYYREKYGERAWKGELAKQLSGTSDKQSTAYRSAIRHFQGERLQKASPKLASRFEAVGQKLPSIGRSLRNNQITLTVKGDQQNGPRPGTRPRTITVTFKGPDARAFITSPNFPAIWREYGVDPDVFEEGDYALDVTSVT